MTSGPERSIGWEGKYYNLGQDLSSRHQADPFSPRNCLSLPRSVTNMTSVSSLLSVNTINDNHHMKWSWVAVWSLGLQLALCHRCIILANKRVRVWDFIEALLCKREEVFKGEI